MKCTENRSVGMPELGQQHGQVFERFMQVKQIMAKHRGWNSLHSALAALVKSFDACFALEEALMRIHACPGYESHKEEHLELLQSVRAMEIANLTTGLTEKMIGTAFAATMKHHLARDRRQARTCRGREP